MDDEIRLGRGRVTPAHRDSGPALPDAYVPRPRVDALLDRVTQRRLALVVAPAGTGKSVAVAGWAAAHPSLDIRWVSGNEEGDHADAAGPLSGLLSGSTPSPRTVLVLDDADHFPRTASRLLDALVGDRARVPALLLLARHEPDRVPMTLRFDEQVAALGYAELRFDPDEAARLVRALRPEIGALRVETSVEQCRGWAAALVLTAQSLPTAEPASYAAHITSRPLLDYLTSDVLLDLPPDLRHVLTAVCQEPEVDADQASILSGVPDAGQLLAEAAADGFLVETTVSSADEVPAWRTHPLLAEVLRRRTGPDGPDREVVIDAHRRAAEYYGRAGDAHAALRHAVLTGELPVQLAALRRYAVELLMRGDGREVARAIDLIPSAVRTASVELLALDSLVLRALGRYDDAKVAGDMALAAAQGPVAPGSPADRSRDAEADLAILEIWQARCGWRRAAAARARAARVLGCADHHGSSRRQLAHDHDAAGVSPLRIAWLMLDLAALELWSDDLAGAAVHIAAAQRYSRVAGVPRLHAGGLGLQAVLEMVEGSYQTAAHTAGAALEVLADHGLTQDTSAANAHLAQGLARFQALDLDGAAEDLAAVDAARSDPFSPTLRAYRRVLTGDLLTASGGAAAAEQLFAEVDATPGLPRTAVRHLSMARVRAAASITDVPAIESAARLLQEAGHELEAGYAHGLALGLRGEIPEAVELFDRMLGADPPTKRSGSAATAVAEAMAAVAIARVAFLLRLGTPDAANRARHLLPDALNRLVPQRLLWLATAGQLISPRFSDHLDLEASRIDGHPFAAVAAAALRRQPREHLEAAPAMPTPAAREAAATLGLTPRELDVLEALAAGGSNAAVASALYLSENTVKTHLAALYRKLGAAGRADAIAKARQAGVL